MAVWLAENDLWLAVENDLVNARAEGRGKVLKISRFYFIPCLVSAWHGSIFPRYRTKSARARLNRFRQEEPFSSNRVELTQIQKA
jgi:hypothetical protein